MRASKPWRHALLAAALTLSFASTSYATPQLPSADVVRPTASQKVARAMRKVEQARADLNRAVAEIRKDPPRPEDITTAEKAVVALKLAIDQGAAHEAEDLDYAKVALAARKQLRKQRAYVKKRSSNARIHESWRNIDQARDALRTAVVKTARGNRADFDQARSAADALQRALDRDKGLSGGNADYDRHRREVAVELTKLRKQIQQNEAKQRIDKEKTGIEEARRAVTTALAPIFNDKVTDQQFSAAANAIKTLSQRVEAAASLGKLNTAFRKYTSTVRKELDDSKNRLDARWAAVGFERLKAELEPAKADLEQAARALGARNAKDEVVAEARTAAIIVEKLLEKAEDVAARNAKFRRFANEVKKTLVSVQVDLHRKELLPSVKAMDAALRPLSRRRVSQADLDRASRALEAASQALEKGAKLEAQDRAYRAYARDIRRRIKSGRRDIDAKRADIDAAEKKASIADVRSDVARALKTIARRSVTDEQLDEANTAIIVLQKTLDEAKSRDPGLRSYLADSRRYLRTAQKTLKQRRFEVQVERQRRAVSEARKVLSAAMRKIRGRNVPDSRLGDAEFAVESVKEALAKGKHLTRKDRAYATYARDVAKSLSATLKTIAKRRDELAVQAQKSKVRAAYAELRTAIQTLNAALPTPDVVEAARKALGSARSAIEAGRPLEGKLSEYRGWVKKMQASVDRSEQRIAKRKLDMDATNTQTGIESLLRTAESSLANARRPKASSADVQKSRGAVGAVASALRDGAALESQHRSYNRFARGAKKALARMQRDQNIAAQALAFRDGPGNAMSTGAAAARSATETKNLQLSKQEYAKALKSFVSCRQEGTQMLQTYPRIAAATLAIDGQMTSPPQVVKACARQADAVRGPLQRVTGILAFRAGPAQALVRGKELLDGGSGQDALTEFDRCISSGKIVRHKYPALRKKKLDGAGKPMTITEVITACVNYSRKLRKK